VLNPLIVRLAGRRHFRMAARLTHTGRRSGRTYLTPVGARRAGDMVLIPLTFGNQSDWSRNVLAAGHCSLRLAGARYEAPHLRCSARRRPPRTSGAHSAASSGPACPCSASGSSCELSVDTAGS
jgi:deazaflavin-dependent oxidoreductase (nitroreductase family)